MTLKRDTRRIHGVEVGGAPFNINNTNADSKHTDSKHTDSKDTDSKHTYRKNTHTHPWHAIRASAGADI